MYDFDGLNLSFVSGAEKMVRRLIQIEKAVRRNPKAPDFDGLDFVMGDEQDESGAVRVGDFDDWFAEKQKVEAQNLKQYRLFKEEQAAEAQGALADGKDLQQGHFLQLL